MHSYGPDPHSCVVLCIFLTGFHKPHTPYRAPKQFFDLYELDDVALAQQQAFPENTTSGLAWFSCKAEGAQYPIDHAVPYNVTVQRELRRAYYAALSFTDSLIGRLMATFDSLGLAESTVVAFATDHGPSRFCRTLFSDRTRCIAQLRPGSSFLLGALRFLDRSTFNVYDGCVPQGEESMWCACAIPLLGARVPSEHERDRVSREVHRDEGLEEVLGLG